MTVTISDIAELIQEFLPQKFADGTARDVYLRRLIPEVDASAAAGSQWKFKDTGAEASLVNELDPNPAPEQFTWQDVYVATAEFVVTLEVSNRSLVAINRGQLSIDSYVERQIADAQTAMEKKVEEATVGGLASNGFIGLRSWASDAGSPGGINRALFTNWQAYVNANGGVGRPLTMDLMRATSDALIGNTRQGRHTAVLMSPSKATLYRGLNGVGQAQAVFNIGSGERGIMPPVGVGSAAAPLQPIGIFDESPVYRIPSMGGDVVWFLDLDGIRYERVQGAQVSEWTRTNRRSYAMDVTMMLNLVVENPMKSCAAIIDLS